MLLIIVLAIVTLLVVGVVASLGMLVITNALNQAYHDRQAAKYLS